MKFTPLAFAFASTDSFPAHLGSEFRWIENVWRRPGEALTQLRLPASAIEKGKFLIHPGLMDSCFQSSILAAEHEELDTSLLEAIYIPFAVENLCFYHAPSTRLWCHVKSMNPVSETPGSFAESYTHNIQVYDDTGRIIIDVESLHSKRAPKEALLKALRKNPYENHYNVHWKSASLANDEEAVALASKPLSDAMSNILVVSDENKLPALFVEKLNEQGVNVTHVQHQKSGQDNASVGAISADLIADLGNLQQVQDVLAQSVSANAKALDGVVYFVATHTNDASNEVSILEQQHPIYEPA